MEEQLTTEEWENYKRSKARAWLATVRRTKSQLQAAIDEVIELRSTMSITGSYALDGMPRNPNTSDSAILNAICAIEQRCDNLNARVDEYKRVVTAADDVIASLVSHEFASVVIDYHYLRGMNYNDVAKKIGYSETTVRNYITPVALSEVYDKMPHIYRDQIPQAI